LLQIKKAIAANRSSGNDTAAAIDGIAEDQLEAMKKVR